VRLAVDGGLRRQDAFGMSGITLQSMAPLLQLDRWVTADTALRLARYFAMSPAFWLNLQASYDLRLAAANSRDEIAKIEPLHRDAAE
jgi:addiction module HigA family antidote